MRKLIVAVVATGALCALSANGQQLSAQAISPDEKVGNQQNWVFGTNECNFDATNGAIDRIVGFTAAGDMAWIQAYEVDETCDCIGGVDIQMFRTAANPTDMWEGREVTVYLWDDPTNDYDPFDAVLVGEANFIVPVGRGPMLITFPAQRVSGRIWVAGSIFANGTAGGGADPLAEFPAAFNSTIINPNDSSWLAYNETEFDPNDLISQLQTWPNPFRAFPILVNSSECDNPCDPCDMNCDGTVNAVDIEFFIDILFNNGPRCNTCTGDTNGDGSVDAQDIEGFINCLFP